MDMDVLQHFLVAPHAGAWIETPRQQGRSPVSHVAPHAGAWIETLWVSPQGLRWRVAPHAGAWIETLNPESGILMRFRRAPRGRVD